MAVLMRELHLKRVIRYWLKVGAAKDMDVDLFTAELGRLGVEDVEIFFSLLGITPELFHHVLLRVGPRLPTTIDGKEVGPAVSLPLTNRFLYRGEPTRELGQQWGVPPSKVQSIINACLLCIIEEYADPSTVGRITVTGMRNDNWRIVVTPHDARPWANSG